MFVECQTWKTRPRVKLRGRVFQVWHSTNNRGALVDQRAGADGVAAGDQKIADLRDQVARIVQQRGYKSPAVVSYKPVGDQLLPGAPSIHFGANRGTNQLQACDALFVVGAPLPGLEAIKETAAMLYFERDEPWRGDWHAIDVPFTGQAAAYTVGGFWDDPDLTTLLRQLREAELVQSVHRARPLRRQVDIWLLTNIVTDLPVDLVSLHDLFEATDAAGQPLRGVDLLRWPAVLDLAATEADPLTAARIADEMGVSGKTAQRWLAALLETGRYRSMGPLARPGRGPKPIGIVKHFDLPK